MIDPKTAALWGDEKPGQLLGFDKDGERCGIDPPQMTMGYCVQLTQPNPAAAAGMLTSEPAAYVRLRTLLAQARGWWRADPVPPGSVECATLHDVSAAEVLAWMASVDKAMKEAP